MDDPNRDDRLCTHRIWGEFPSMLVLPAISQESFSWLAQASTPYFSKFQILGITRTAFMTWKITVVDICIIFICTSVLLHCNWQDSILLKCHSTSCYSQKKLQITIQTGVWLRFYGARFTIFLKMNTIESYFDHQSIPVGMFFSFCFSSCPSHLCLH